MKQRSYTSEPHLFCQIFYVTQDLILPGTHNSASNTISKWIPFSAIGICQNVSVYEQLIRGARYIDLRIGSGSERRLQRRRRKNATIPSSSCHVEDIVIVHGILNGSPFSDIIKEIDTFLNVHDGEFVIIDIQFDRNKHTLSNEQRLHLLEFVSFTFNDRFITHADATSWFLLKTATLGELLLVHKKNVLILLNDGMVCNFYHDGSCYDANTVARKFGCHSNHHFLTNQWHNSSCPRTLLDKNAIFLEKNGNCSNKFVISQLVLTPQPPKTIIDIIRLLLGSKSLRPVSLARELYQRDLLETAIRNNAEKKLSIVLLALEHYERISNIHRRQQQQQQQQQVLGCHRYNEQIKEEE
ncbi:hypothetical protein ACHAWU_007517 [Discostella pseudostelligera]|uniref:Phosphatidylinositol-specific phospholipase C X domain-containing protein n=1 Tax=Discostella pseudostelligera TaxID=259834 RepID=A0ABD3MA45_9STRA